MKIDLDCQTVSHLISEGLDRKLPTGERARLRLHFVLCSTCRNVNEQMQFLRRAMRALADDRGEASPPGHEPPPDDRRPD